MARQEDGKTDTEKNRKINEKERKRDRKREDTESEIDFFLNLFDQQSEYNVFHKLMSWHESSLWTL